ncbi:MAG TPA: hypothetical protein PKH07_18255, partial [bacterium]|nr:hypothetical protein [bacterium]
MFTLAVSVHCIEPVAEGILSGQRVEQDRAAKRQLLQDTRFTCGVQHGIGNTYPDDLDEACRARWMKRVPSLAHAKWRFTEIAEKTYFAENPDTPTRNNALTYASPDASKQFIIAPDGLVRFVFDSAKEWRQGCRLDLPDEKGTMPRFGSPNWNWPHFLINQVIVDASDESHKVHLEKYDDIILSATVTLRDIAKTGQDCGDQVPDHAIFYFAFVLENQKGESPHTFYALVNALYTEDGSTHVSVAPWLGNDPINAAVFFCPGYPALAQGETTDYHISV